MCENKRRTVKSGISYPDEILKFKSKHKIVYIAGPMSGMEKNNYPAFKEAQKYLKKCGFIVLSPAFSIPNGKYEDYMRRDIQMLLLADCLCILPNASMSPGANLEISIARSLKLEMFRYCDSGISMINKTKDGVK